MIQRCLALILLYLLAACAGPLHDGAVQPAWFGRAAPAADERPKGRIALLVPASVQDNAYVGERLLGMPTDKRRVRVPSGQIVAQSAMAALEAASPGRIVPLAAPPAGNDRFSATLVIDAVRYRYRERIQMVMPLPLPVIGTILIYSEIDNYLAFDVRLLDADGRAVMSRTYEAGPELVQRPQDRYEMSAETVLRTTHETAARLSRQMARDLIDWLQADRAAPREL